MWTYIFSYKKIIIVFIYRWMNIIICNNTTHHTFESHEIDLHIDRDFKVVNFTISIILLHFIRQGKWPKNQKYETTKLCAKTQVTSRNSASSAKRGRTRAFTLKKTTGNVVQRQFRNFFGSSTILWL